MENIEPHVVELRGRRERIITAYLEGWGGGDMATLYAETLRDIGLRPARAPRERSRTRRVGSPSSRRPPGSA